MAWGSVESIVINSRRFSCDADTGCEITLPGFSMEKKPNGDGTSRNLMKRKIGKLEDLTLSLDNPNEDGFEFLQECANSFDDYPVSLTLVDGTVFGGKMHLTGDDLKLDAKEGTCKITLEGTLERQ